MHVYECKTYREAMAFATTWMRLTNDIWGSVHILNGWYPRAGRDYKIVNGRYVCL